MTTTTGAMMTTTRVKTARAARPKSEAAHPDAVGAELEHGELPQVADVLYLRDAVVYHKQLLHFGQRVQPLQLLDLVERQIQGPANNTKTLFFIQSVKNSPCGWNPSPDESPLETTVCVLSPVILWLLAPSEPNPNPRDCAFL